MGVYDTVKWRGETYQTKGLSRQMFQYEVVNERLYVKMPTRMPYDGPPLFDTNITEGLAAVNYHGLLEIHYPSIVIWFSDGRVRKVYHLVEEVERRKSHDTSSPKPDRALYFYSAQIKKRETGEVVAESSGVVESAMIKTIGDYNAFLELVKENDISKVRKAIGYLDEVYYSIVSLSRIHN